MTTKSVEVELWDLENKEPYWMTGDSIELVNGFAILKNKVSKTIIPSSKIVCITERGLKNDT